jgi:hypothetical protein
MIGVETAIISITGIGIVAFVGDKILEHTGNTHLRMTLNIILLSGSVAYIAYTLRDTVREVMSIWL